MVVVGKAAFSKEEKQPVGTDHLTLIHTELEKLSQRQVELDAEVEGTKTKIGASQKRTIDMIKECKIPFFLSKERILETTSL